MIVLNPFIFAMPREPFGSSGLVSTSKTLNPLSLKSELILRAWMAIPPYGGGKGEIMQMLFLLSFNVFIV